MSENILEAVASKQDVIDVRDDIDRARSDLGRRIELAVRAIKICTGGMLIALFAALTAIKFFG